MVLTFLAQTATPTTTQPASGAASLLIFLLPVALIVFMMRKQGKQRREHMDLVSAIEVGDEVETVAGMFGRVKSAKDDTLVVEFSPGMDVKVSRASIRRRIIQAD